MVLKKVSFLIFGLLIITPLIYANATTQEVPFDLRGVIEQVAHHPKVDGSTIKINGRYYEARFEKDGIILKERHGNKQFKIYLDEANGNATVSDNEVLYSLSNGKLSITGQNRGLKFRKEIKEKKDLRYRLRTEGDAARLSGVSVTDRSGRKLKPEIIKHREAIEIRLSKKQASGLKFPLTLAGEFMIDTTKIYGPSEQDEWSPAVAFDGTNYFVVWGDYDQEAVVGARVTQIGEVLDKPGIIIADEAYGAWEEDGPAIVFGGGNYLVVWTDWNYWNIFRVRVSTAGVVLDTPAVICTTQAERYLPSVAFDGSNFFVVWTDGRRYEEDIYGTRVSASGQVLDPAGIPIDTAEAEQYEPAVTFGGTNYFVAWSDWRGGFDQDIYGTRVTTAGIALDTGFPISTATENQARPSVTFGSGNYFVVWDDYRSGYYRHIYGARVTQTGVVLDPTGISVTNITEEQYSPTVAFDGANYFAVWLDWRGDGDIYGARVSAAGIALDPAGIEICTDSTDEKFIPSVVFGGTNYFVVWTDFRFICDIFGSRVNTAGTPLDPNGILITLGVSYQWNPQVAFDGINYLVVWYDDALYGSRVSATGVVLDPTGFPISTPDYAQWNYKVVFDGTNFFIVWEDLRDGDWYPDIYGARVSTAGIVLDPAGIPIATGSYSHLSPQVVFGGNNYFVVWQDYRGGTAEDIYGARVSTTGTILDPAGIPISTAIGGQGYPKIVFGGNNYFIVWQDYRSGLSADIYGARVSTAGAVLDPVGIPISTATDWQANPEVIFGTDYLVVWQDYRSGLSADIYGARVSTAGAVLDPVGIPISTATDWQEVPQIIFGGNNYFVLWQDWRSGSGYTDIYGTRISTAGIVLDPSGIPISTASYYQWNPRVTFDGSDFLVVWEDDRDGDWEFDIYGAKVTMAGTVTEFAVSTLTGNQSSIALAKGSGNQVFVVWEGWTPAPYNSDRIWGKLIVTQIQPPHGWTLMNPVPTNPLKRKKVKSGGSLVAVGDSLIYCLKGNNTNEFYCYDVNARNWTQKESVPYSPVKSKRVKGGAALAYLPGDSLIYATKGNNTLEFLSYNILRNTWKHLKPIPSAKGLKGGTGLSWDTKNGDTVVFLLKGSKSSENFAYFPKGDTWLRLPDAPVIFKKGSCLTHGGDPTYGYVLHDKDNRFYRVDIDSLGWVALESMPKVGAMGKKKKVKEGAALAADDSVTIYAFKGGNTQEFWSYNAITGHWTELESIPRGSNNKKVKAGGALAFIPTGSKGRGEGEIFALKGGNTDEFWMYETTGVEPLFAGQFEDKLINSQTTKFSIIPNPSNGCLTINHNLNPLTSVRIKIYSVAGILLRQTEVRPENDQIKLYLKDLSQGVYILRLENGDYRTSQKLIIQK